MSFPNDVVVDLLLNGIWVELSAEPDRVSRRRPIHIDRGQQNESGETAPSECALEVYNRDGKMSPDNPLSAFYGQLDLNTPLRVALRLIKDTASTNVTDGWGSTDTHPDGAWWVEPWTNSGSGGTVQNSDWQKTGDKATQSVPATSAFRRSRLNGALFRDVEVRVTFTLPFTDVTGAPIEPANIMLRGRESPSTEYYLVRVTVETNETIKVALVLASGATIAAAVTVPNITHAAGQQVTVVGQIEGQTLRARVYLTSAGEPDTWHIKANDTTLKDAGYVGIRTGVASGNTNALPIVASYDNIEVLSRRATVELASIPPRWDQSAKDAHVPMVAAGIMRRLAQNTPPDQSALTRYVMKLANPVVAYWPCEDGRDSASIASARPANGGPMSISGGTPTFASFSDFAASGPLPVLKNSVWVGQVAPYTPESAFQVRFLLHIPAAGLGGPGAATLIRINTTGTKSWYDLRVGSSGLWTFNIGPPGGAGGANFGSSQFGKLLHVQIEVQQNGPDFNWAVRYAPIGGTEFVESGTVTGNTCGRVLSVEVNMGGSLNDATIGQIYLKSDVTTILAGVVNAHRDEKAADRIARLCAEEGIDFSLIGAAADTAAMSPQLVNSFLELVRECEKADGGTLFEPRGVFGLSYETRVAKYNQDPTLGLDLAAGHVAPGFDPTYDDQQITNVIKLSRTNGSSVRVQVDTGARAVSKVGEYEHSDTINVATDDQLQHQAEWRAHLSTVAGARYPQISFDFALLDAAKQRQLLDLDIDDRVTVDNLAALKIYRGISQLVRGVSEDLSTYQHKITVNGKPETPWQLARVDDDARGKAGSGDSTLAVGIDADDTSLSVASGTLWTTDAAQMPIPITIGGEDMSVTNITGSSSPQTFTVTRNLNGLPGGKSHAAGAAVALTRRATVGLRG